MRVCSLRITLCILIVFIVLTGCKSSSSGPSDPCNGTASFTYGPDTYHTVAIGDQCWMKENLNYGTMINSATISSNNGLIEKFCYNNDAANCVTYGGLYEWNEAMNYTTAERSKGICPDGWHIPSAAEYQTLITSVSNSSNALKAVSEGAGAGAGTNTSGFTALLGGTMSAIGNFAWQNANVCSWASTSPTSNTANFLSLNSNDNVASIYSDSKYIGLSIRCIKD